jgi:hypothetical protein
MSHRARVLAVTGTLAYSFAVVVHVLVHVIGSADAASSLVPHIVEAAIAGVALLLSGWWLGAFAGGAERRRRLALVRGDLRVVTRCHFSGALGSVALMAAGLFLAEGATVDADRGVVAVLSSVIALALTALCLRSAGARFVAVVGWFARPAGAPRRAARALERSIVRLPVTHRRLLRRLQFRGPPLLLALS